MKGNKGFILLAAVVACALGAAGFLTVGPRSAVGWGAIRAVVIESDDWGLAGFVPDARAWWDLDRRELETGAFPAVYWLSTLEDSTMVARVDDVLGGHLGRDGHPAVLQPNYVMSSLAYDAGRWEQYDLPDLPPAYRRDGLWSAVGNAVDRGTWYPEFHATWHYDPQLRKNAALGSDLAVEVTRRGILLFPGSERAWELGAWRSGSELARELDHSLGVFRDLFGRRVDSVIAPDYHWDARIENLWASRGLRLIQAKREQLNPAWGSGTVGRLGKYVMRQWDRLRFPDRIYLERNCRLEPVQAPDPEAVLRTCVTETRAAWAGGQPAVVESHRINYAHTDKSVVDLGLDILDRYLGEISGDQSGEPLFLTDDELGQLYVRGVSWNVRGGVVVVRNATHARRVVAVPARAFELAAAQGGRGYFPARPVVFVAVPSASSVDIIP